MRALVLALAALLAAGPAPAEKLRAGEEPDYVETTGRLSDETFYRLIACGAPPGGDCTMPFVRWPQARARNLRIQLDVVPVGYPDALAGEMSDALDRAIAEINDAGADLHLRRTRGKEEGDVLISMLNTSAGEEVRGSGVRDLEGAVMGAAFVYVWWDGSNRITDARILMADDMPLSEVYPVLLEELSQSLGFLNDIRNPIYNAVSVFSEDSNAVMTLGRQDRAIMRRHYPR